MHTFEYHGFDHSGAVCKGLVQALDVKDARKRLIAQGVLPDDIALSSKTHAHSLFRKRGFNTEFRASFYRELSALVTAGFPLVKSLEMLIDSPEMEPVQLELSAVRDAVQEGVSFAASFKRHVPTVGQFEVSILEVGEETATFSRVLDDLALFLEEQASVKSKIISALFYPSLVVLFAVVIAIVMLGWVLPGYMSVLDGANVELPWLTQTMMAVGSFCGTAGVPLLVGVVLAMFIIQRLSKTNESVESGIDRVRFKLPLISRGWSLVCSMRFARTLSIMLRGGVPLLKGMEYAGKATGSILVRESVQIQTQSVLQGGTLADAVRQVPALSRYLPSWIHAGESSGQLADMLEKAAERVAQKWDRFVNRALSLVEPLLILGVGIFVLLVMLAVLLPISELRQAMMNY